ncbi:MAG: UDP-N-acetylglucosamine 1-carboxyvinyltransferase [Candidatus Lloydbacteria bacterium CG22_combo_CG10-13_8_21_14_all_47_15]|uniref:UDP-N-acetylglucosamine 1-carboxyvinyltransferase n=1 Tax=Candidatus Lloydbacteria bacterium CG22_combo_CG10-13_8_21_14_all_47_15 TaxID=1974635 RepID=A0A2H0CUF1_9BACT|nr:MAG: UDP-N-acetylglucosamine 1-carboxyvinyltransferase [Candidatus Lloydbacteria bacterium CG22_combo_CG10-13_8_21_14_all_47_15]
MTSSFIVSGLGGRKLLSGTIRVNGSKNALAPALAAPFIFREPLSLAHTPLLEDLRRTEELFAALGVETTAQERTYTFTVPKIINPVLPEDIAKRMRASILFTGPILARFGSVSFPHPGGCVIGERPIDIFLDGYRAMGASVKVNKRHYYISAPKGGLRGAMIYFRVQSVTATETFALAALLARGTTILKNAAVEPEITALLRFLEASGARIEGIGTHTLVIRGGGLLACKAPRYEIMPDRIEAGCFLILAALAGRDVTIAGCEPSHLDSIIAFLSDAGVPLSIGKRNIVISAKKSRVPYRSVNIKTHEYPGFPTDLQAPAVVFLTQAAGDAAVFETIFEGRLNYVHELNRMGASIRMMDPHRVLVKGPTKLVGKTLESPDLRAGLAYIIAGIIANGRSVIHNAYHVDRGYEQVEERLRGIGANIVRMDDVGMAETR